MTATEEVTEVTEEEEAATPTDSVEDRQERFVRVAGRRANRVLSDMELLARTANRSGGYLYTDEQADEIVSKLQAGVDMIAAGYAGNRREKLTVEL